MAPLAAVPPVRMVRMVMVQMVVVLVVLMATSAATVGCGTGPAAAAAGRLAAQADAAVAQRPVAPAGQRVQANRAAERAAMVAAEGRRARVAQRCVPGRCRRQPRRRPIERAIRSPGGARQSRPCVLADRYLLLMTVMGRTGGSSILSISCAVGTTLGCGCYVENRAESQLRGGEQNSREGGASVRQVSRAGSELAGQMNGGKRWLR